MFKCRKCGTLVWWNDWRGSLREGEGVEWKNFINGQELDWLISLLPDANLKMVREVLEGMDAEEDYDMFSGGHISFLIREISRELMCRREGMNRMVEEKRECEERQRKYREEEEDERDSWGDADIGEEAVISAPDSPPLSHTRDENVEGAEWI